MAGRCAIYETRPEVCRAFPRATDWRPIACTYGFAEDGTRTGECDSAACGADACCNFPRAGGAPDGAFSEGARACEHLEGLEGARPTPGFAQMTASELWVGAQYGVYVARRPGGYAIARVHRRRVLAERFFGEGAFWSGVREHDGVTTLLVVGPEGRFGFRGEEVRALRRLQIAATRQGVVDV